MSLLIETSSDKVPAPGSKSASRRMYDRLSGSQFLVLKPNVFALRVSRPPCSRVACFLVLRVSLFRLGSQLCFCGQAARAGPRNRSGEECALFGTNPRLQILRSRRIMNRFQCNWVQNEAVVFVVRFPGTPGSHLTARGAKNSTEAKTHSKNTARQHFF